MPTVICGHRIRRFEIGTEKEGNPSQKNRLFLGSPHGGQAAAAVFSLIQACKELGITPEAYLKDVLIRLPTTKQKDIDELPPNNWKSPAD